MLERFQAEATVELAPGTVMQEGEQEVRILASDGTGRTAEAEALVTLALRSVTLTDGQVTASSTFRSDDVLTASVTESGAVRDLVLANGADFAALDAVITVPGDDGATVVRVLDDGRQVAVATTSADGVHTFEGPSKATYRITAPADAGEGDEGPGGAAPNDEAPGGGGAGPGGTPGGSPGDTPGGSSEDGAAGGSRGPLARTGFDAYALAIGAAGLIVLGGALAVRRRD